MINNIEYLWTSSSEKPKLSVARTNYKYDPVRKSSRSRQTPNSGTGKVENQLEVGWGYPEASRSNAFQWSGGPPLSDSAIASVNRRDISP